ncbi:MAG: proton-conducting transporter membrane subunit [Bacteroidota bacterium]
MVISPIHYIFVPLVAAFAIPLLSKINKELPRIIPGIVMFYNIIISFVLMQEVNEVGYISEVIAGWEAPWGINLVITPFSGFLVSLISVLGFLIWLYGFRFKKVIDAGELRSYNILQMMMITGAIGIIITGDIFNMFVFLEIVAITAISLTSFYRGRDGAEAGFKYLLIGGFASALILLAILILYTQVGTLNMAEIAERMHTVPQGIKATILLLFIVGFGIEAELFPLNGWAPDAYSQAPGPTSSAFAGIVVKAGVYGLIRIIFTLFDVDGAYDFLITAGLITMIIAEASALRQTNLKRMLAYSSIGQMGLALIAFGIGTKEAVFGAMFLLFNHAVIKSLLFMTGSILIYNSKDKTINSLSGIAKKLPFISILFAIGAFAIVGLPPFSGFWSKLYVLTAAADENMILLIAAILAVSVVEIVYYFRVVGKLYFPDKESNIEVYRPKFNAMIAMGVLGVVILVIGFYPDLITGYLHNAADILLDKASYIRFVLNADLPIQ